MTSVLITDCEALFAEGLECLLTNAGFTVRTVGRSLGAGLVLNSVERFQPDIILVGMSEVDRTDALDIIRRLAGAECRVIAVVGTDDPVVWATCLEQGALAVIGKGQHADDLIASIKAAAAGGTPMPSHARDELLAVLRRARTSEQQQLAPFRQLTAREAEVLAGLIDGRTATQLAKDLGVRLTTVRSHIRAALQKLGVKSQLAAVAMARRAGWPSFATPDAPADLRVIPSERRISLEQAARGGSYPWIERDVPHVVGDGADRGTRYG